MWWPNPFKNNYRIPKVEQSTGNIENVQTVWRVYINFKKHYGHVELSFGQRTT
jgi:hypothetical protein